MELQSLMIHIKLSAKQPVAQMPIEQAIDAAQRAFAQRNIDSLILISQQLINAAPEHIAPFHLVFPALLHLKKFQQLNQIATKAVEYHQQDATSYYYLAMSWRYLRNPMAAENSLAVAVQLQPENTQWRCQYGRILKENNKMPDAINCFNQCIIDQPEQTYAYWLRSDLVPSLNEQQISTLKLVTEQAQPEPATTAHTGAEHNNNKIYAAFTLYRHFEHTKDYRQAMAYLQLANQWQRAQFSYDHQAELAEHRAIQQAFSPLLLANTSQYHQHSDNDTDKQQNASIFICGLPRSGTTLVEQIIATHNSVTAGDELLELAQATQHSLTKIQPKQAFPHWANELNTEDWQDIGANYMQLTQHLQSKRYFTDKMPLNYKAIGLISKALPQAKIIYCSRHPMDIIFGCFKQHLGQGHQFAYDLNELTEMLIAHQQLMQYWIEHLPHKIFILKYEDLIDNQEAISRQLLAFLDLDWQPQCLTFYSNNNTVHTISNSQIRQPLFTHGKQNWLRYQQQLQPYADKLHQAGLKF